jgi:hypothetical protein
MPSGTASAVAGLCLLVSTTVLAATVKSEPPMGGLREGQVVLVDDGSCPAGELKRVVGGNHTKASGTKSTIRQYSCVPRR